MRGISGSMETEHGRIIVGETCIDATVEAGYLGQVEGLIFECRKAIERKISEDPFFGSTYSPLRPLESDPLPVRWMCESSMAASVGPMAAVAGTVGRFVMEKLRSMGCRHIVLDNDGDLAIMSHSPLSVSIYTGSDLFPLIPLCFGPSPEGIGICTSSGKVGHSVSLGASDSATVIAKDPSLADACATRLGNLSGKDPAEACEEACSIDGVIGAILVSGETASVCGDVPLGGGTDSVIISSAD